MQCSRDWFSLDHELKTSLGDDGECVVFPEALMPSLRLLVATPGSFFRCFCSHSFFFFFLSFFSSCVNTYDLAELENVTVDNVEMKMRSIISVENENSTLQTLQNILDYLLDMYVLLRI
jgi:hypothetical protein